MDLTESFRSRARSGFSLIELLVVIVIIAVLSAAGGGAYMHFIEQARRSNASDTCAQIATAWTNYHRELGFWPDPVGKSGVQEMDTEMCEILGKAGLLDVLYVDDSETNSGLTRNRQNDPELAVGLLSPVGLELFERGVRGARVEEHLYQFVLDANEDGVVDSSDGLPGEFGGVKVRGDAAVWCWPEDEDARRDGEVYGCNW